MPQQSPIIGWIAAKGHSPIIVWLLVAASIASCAVALSWTAKPLGSGFAEIAYFAMLNSYLSVVCLWSALRPRRNFWSRGAPVAAVLVASVAMILNNQPENFVAFLAIFGAHAATLLGALWVFRRSRYWKQRSGTETNWQFSVAELLAVMTVVALLIVAFQRDDVWQDGGDETAFFVGSTVLAIASTCLWSLRCHWLLRLAGVFAVALVVSVPSYFTKYGEDLFFFVIHHFLTEALVLAVWLAWGGILPVMDSVDAA